MHGIARIFVCIHVLFRFSNVTIQYILVEGEELDETSDSKKPRMMEDKKPQSKVSILTTTVQSKCTATIMNSSN